MYGWGGSKQTWGRPKAVRTSRDCQCGGTRVALGVPGIQDTGTHGEEEQGSCASPNTPMKVFGAVRRRTLLFVLPLAALAAGSDPLLHRGVGAKGPLRRGWGPASEGYCPQERRPEWGIVLSVPGLLGMLVFWVIKSSDLGGSRPWQALNSYCPFSSPAEWEAGWLCRAGGMHGIPTPLPGTARCRMPPPLPSAPCTGLG